MKYWEKVLYPHFLSTISGTAYSVISDEELDNELYYLTCRAIAAFKFPKYPLNYDCIYVDENNEVVGEDDNWVAKHWYFERDDITYREIEILVAWMKVYWIENQISNADNFLQRYTDHNIHTYSPANELDKHLKSLRIFKDEAKELENRYSRVSSRGTPALGDVVTDE